jgi:hypothetical protein
MHTVSVSGGERERERERGKRGDQVKGGQVKSKSFEI